MALAPTSVGASTPVLSTRLQHIPCVPIWYDWLTEGWTHHRTTGHSRAAIETFFHLSLLERNSICSFTDIKLVGISVRYGSLSHTPLPQSSLASQTFTNNIRIIRLVPANLVVRQLCRVRVSATCEFTGIAGALVFLLVFISVLIFIWAIRIETLPTGPSALSN